MAEIVLGIGTSHSPLLAIDPSLWSARGEDDRKRKTIFLSDGRVLTYAELAVESRDRFSDRTTLAVFESQARQAQLELDRLAADIEAAAPDVIIVIGDDQEELFGKSHMPALAVFTGPEIVMHPKSKTSPNLPEWYQRANEGYLMDSVHRHPGAPAIAIRLVEDLIEKGIDLSIATEVEDPHVAGFGHAYGFVIERLLARRAVPLLPIILNTYYPPNVLTPRRCYEVGRKLADACAALTGDTRICIVASGGLTHFATDEAFDRRILDALRQHDVETLTSLPVKGLRSGNSEILNWVMAAGALETLLLTESNYIPVHRTPAGTGIGLAFCTWRP